MRAVAATTRLFDAAGNTLSPGELLGRGGEAIIYSVAGSSSQALKLYHRPSATQAEKLALMINNPPELLVAQQHVTLAWPTGLVRNERHQVRGFLMPRIPNGVLSLHQLYNPRTRRQRAPGLSWAYLLRIARNLAAVVATLHDKGYVIGDLNESNILVTERALVTLVDCDSVQVRGARQKVYRCGVGKPEYTPPELQGKAFKDLTRSPQHDAFGLAVLLFLLLMEGVHPFAGIHQGAGESPSLAENIRLGQSAFFGKTLTPPLSAPELTLLPANLRRDFARAFKNRAGRPYFFTARPSARDWQQSLESFEALLIVCPNQPQHLYSQHLGSCPWCARLERLGLDAFPRTGTPAPVPQQPAAQPRQTKKSWLNIFPVITALPLLTGLLSLWLGSGNASHLWGLGLLLTSLVVLAAARTSHARQHQQRRLYGYCKRLELGLEAVLSGGLLAASVRLLSSSWLETTAMLPLYWFAGASFLLGFALLWRLRRRLLLA